MATGQCGPVHSLLPIWPMYKVKTPYNPPIQLIHHLLNFILQGRTVDCGKVCSWGEGCCNGSCIGEVELCGNRVKERERERKIYIFPWLQVCITGPRHHLTSSLWSYCRGRMRLDTIYSVFRVWSLGYTAWFVCSSVGSIFNHVIHG